MKLNTWPIETDADGNPNTAEFGPDDFEGWWLAGMDRDDRLTAKHRREMLGAMVYIAEAEGREMLQTVARLRAAIDYWADEWNAETAHYTRDVDGRCVRRF